MLESHFNKFAGLKALPKACNFIKKETLAQVFSCEFCEISKNTFFYRTSPVAASVRTMIIIKEMKKLFVKSTLSLQARI